MPFAPSPKNALSDFDTAAPRRVLGVREAVTLIVGLVIGAGIFKTPATVAGLSGNSTALFIAWLLGGVVSLIGALCYAELATAYPDAGGDYHFLQRAYGRPVAFLFGWARFSVITTGSIALLAFVFGDYMNRIVPLDLFRNGSGTFFYAVSVVFLLSWLNVNNLRTGIATQTVLTALQIVCLFLIVATALFLSVGGTSVPPVTVESPLPPTSLLSSGFGLAMVFVLLTFGGWNEAAYISAEIRGGHRHMVKALLFSIVIITALYLLVNWAYWKGLGYREMSASHAVAADLMQTAFGKTGEKFISLMIAISALTSINATLIVGARTSYALGRDWPIFVGLGTWDTTRNTPVHAIWAQCFASLLLISLGAFLGSGFKAMVEFTAPVFWGFFLLTGLSLFILRRKEPHTPRPFRVPFYPVLPAVFCMTCALMLWSSLSYVYDQSLGGVNAAWIGVSVLSAGGLLLLILNRIAPRQKQSIPPS